MSREPNVCYVQFGPTWCRSARRVGIWIWLLGSACRTASNRWGCFLSGGGAVVTPGGDLSADFVIHVVVSAPDEPETSVNVQKALRNGLRRAADLDPGIAGASAPGHGCGKSRS
jgi:O-acetyl-ADP-ribose deacetylase (regulator of RNase III)